jgi:hypothetical protein
MRWARGKHFPEGRTGRSSPRGRAQFPIPFYLYCPRQRAHGTQPQADRFLSACITGKRRSVGTSAREMTSALSAHDMPFHDLAVFVDAEGYRP